MTITSLNALVEALQNRLPISRVLISNIKTGKKIDLVKELCRKNKIPVQLVPQGAINRKAEGKHQGVFAEISPIRFYHLEEILKKIRRGLILILDSMTDTGNMGAVIRTAVAAEVDAIIIPQRNSAPINETVLKTSAGALLKAKIVISKNLNQEVRKLQQNQFWVVGADMDGEIPYFDFDFTGKTAVILGSESKGISQLLKKNADQIISIPHSNQVESLNVSNAAAVILFEAARQKLKK